jgi:hypothetical protein
MDRTREMHDLLVMFGITAAVTVLFVAAVMLFFRRGKKITDL